MKRYFIYITLLILSTNLSFGQKGVVKGRVFNDKNNEPLPFVNILIYGTKIGAVSDLDGNFSFFGIEPGFIKLEASYIGFEKKISSEIQVTNAKTVFVDIPMKETQLNLNTVEIKASPFEKKEETPLSVQKLRISEIEKSPGGNRDISKVLQTLPGVASSLSYRNDIIVRGGGSSENKFYLDGVEIPNLNHFATQGASGGAVGIINTDFLREVDFYTGAFPANRGNALSSILDMKQIDGNKEKLITKAAIGASDMALTLNGPINDKSNFIFSARRSYLQFLFSALGLPFLPTYNDFQFKYKYKPDIHNELTIIGLGAIDNSRLNLNANETEEQRYILNYLPENDQWNYTIGAVYKHFYKNGYNTFVMSRNMLRNISFKYQNNDKQDSLKIQDYSSDEIENKFRFENNTRINNFKVVSGVGFEYARYLNNTFQKIFFNNLPFTINYNTNLDLFKWNLFMQASKSYLNNRLNLSFGIRTDANSYSKNMSNMLQQLSPRLSGSYVLTEKINLNLNTGRYVQSPAYTTMGYKNNDNIFINKTNNLKYIAVDQIVTGFDYSPRELNKISLEGFYKSYSRYPFSVKDSIAIASKGADFGIFGDEEVTSTGKGRAYGFELLYREQSIKDLNIILSYTFVRSEFKDQKENYIPSSWDNKHLLNLTVLKKFKRNWEFGLKWRFVGGAPYTPYDINKSSIKEAWDIRGQGYLDYSRYNSVRLDPFHQLDIRVDKEYFFNKWSLNLYVDIQNLYNFKSDNAPVILLSQNADGTPITDPLDPSKYILKSMKTSSGTVLPTIGLIIEF